MIIKYKQYLELLQDKLKTIDFYLEDEDISSATFGNNSSWKIIFEGDRFIESPPPSYNIWIRNIIHPDAKISRIGFSLVSLMEKNISHPNFKLNNMLDFLIENKEKVFDEIEGILD